jgi:CubicO group peptidase (beta-lactamase class C family)
MKRFVVLLVYLFLAITGHSQSIDRAKLDSLFNNLENHNLAIGGVAISFGGKVVYQRSFGKNQVPQTEYRIGSISKMFTAVLTYQLIDEKKLSLKQTLSTYFPDLPNADRITIAELLGHRSGLANFTNNTNYDEWKDQPKTHEQLLLMIKNQKPDFEPNAKADYNNSNYLLLSYILEKIYHKPYKAIVNEKIIKRLNLSHTYYGLNPGFQPGEAISYHYINSEWKQDKAAYLDNFSGAGAIISTPPDMLKFINGLFEGRLISKASLDTMKTIRDGYGKGMFPYGDEKHDGFGHNGKTEGFGASLQYYPENKLAIAYCTNGEVYPKAQILDDIFKICFTLPYTLPSFRPVTLSASMLNTYIGNYSSDDGNMQVSVANDKGQLVLSTKGQPFSLVTLSDHEFWNIAFGFFFEFENTGKQLLIKDVDDIYVLHKK